ncbi:diguanylate cyclase [Methylococcus capsulatus]|jgi:diguanylate cyclase (GGDEF)-like protein/PAS domain S-box-containing protein|uniref:Diguanylate cyclase n=1 Tax=Methylococcus capsulatus TaxID=414 RepID=A0AA35XTE1_METCP|nr:EAL domain-containing protein [Methylococcus capsulatus]CAI8792524.1 diguanylate cyclase [Methylococcus capsulatus]
MNETDDRQARILIVDDALANVGLLLDALEPEFDVQCATSGTEALFLLEAGAQPDLILLDVAMPDMDGFEVCRRLKADGRTRDIPVIFLTAEDGEHDETFGLALGAVDYIAKSSPMAIVKARLRNHARLVMQERRLQREIAEHKAAREQLQVAGMVFSASSEGMLLVNADNRIVAVNPAFVALTGYGPEDVVGKDPKLLQSGRHGPAFYQAMWAALEATGTWRGEIWNRRRNGEEYAEHLTINTIYDEAGKVHLRVALFSDITEKKASEALIEFQSCYDALTRLPNRRLFAERLALASERAHRDRGRVALLYIDLDHFKEVNDTLGHHQGDALLVQAAHRVRRCVRESETVTVARLGGDEFTVIVPDFEGMDEVERLARAIIDSLSEPFRLGDQLAHVSASIGITVFPDDAADTDGLLRNADQAMYAAKRAGRNGYQAFNPEMQRAMSMRVRLSQALRDAVQAGQLRLHYQPIVELASGRVCKAEALLRWEHPEFGEVSPAAFIPIAEDCGSIHCIGDWVFERAACQAARWRSRFGTDFQVSINVSPRQFQAGGRDFGRWLERLGELGLDGSMLALEITETLLMDTDQAIADKLAQFRAAGVQIALDDFGTGYSSLAYLKEFRIDYLKIDRTFVRDMTPDSKSFLLSEAIVTMAHRLGLKVIAEGVETPQQYALLERIGCDYFQGYLFSRPLPEDAFEGLLRSASCEAVCP